jgi:hypothetical protein
MPAAYGITGYRRLTVCQCNWYTKQPKMTESGRGVPIGHLGIVRGCDLDSTGAECHVHRLGVAHNRQFATIDWMHNELAVKMLVPDPPCSSSRSHQLKEP